MWRRRLYCLMQGKWHEEGSTSQHETMLQSVLVQTMVQPGRNVFVEPFEQITDPARESNASPISRARIKENIALRLFHGKLFFERGAVGHAKTQPRGVAAARRLRRFSLRGIRLSRSRTDLGRQLSSARCSLKLVVFDLLQQPRLKMRW